MTTTAASFLSIATPHQSPQLSSISRLSIAQIGLTKSPLKPITTTLILRSSSPSSSSANSVVAEEEEKESPSLPSDALPLQDTDSLPLSGCKACGREEIENGCNGEGRIQGGIATVPGFGWWPIKAYRPCPGFVASGGRYRRRGQSMDEVVSGSGGKAKASIGTNDEVQSRNKKQGLKKFKR
ncbi:uncharacterized protein LOC132283931 isoform X2 [Cornus florida]|uniref:uncharacterized protein LOC132283931 isoform X2 n=2 Tax=Cornus florida TaxID=4283 RepID=UPI00289D7A36|nr:uncharacterized protein LOC132283931 isoform X2 [Cornus florida]